MGSGLDDLLAAVDAALAGDWHKAHEVAQSHEGSPHADWLHAILHKIEGDEGNSRYWYARSGCAYSDFPDAKAELAALRKELSG